jgi:ribosomal protein L11 methyltransferase
MWQQLSLIVDKTRADFVETLFESLGAQAVTLGDAGDDPLLEPGPGETPLWQATRVTGLWPADAALDDLRTAINQALSTDVGASLVVERLADRDWERAWLDRFKPMRFGRRLWIRPGGTQVAQADAVIIDLDPGLAFGTGTHPTTALCLAWLDQDPPGGLRVIDFGCGSGVLAIAAAKLGAARVTAVDHDPQAIIATGDNARRNGVSDRVTALHSDAFEAYRADVVVANILANTLLDLRPQITALVAPGGRLALSGVLTYQAAAVQQAYAGDFVFAPPARQAEWVLLSGTRA